MRATPQSDLPEGRGSWGIYTPSPFCPCVSLLSGPGAFILWHFQARRQSEVRSFGLQDDGALGDIGRVTTASASVLYVFMLILIILVMCKSGPPLYGRDTGTWRGCLTFPHWEGSARSG